MTYFTPPSVLAALPLTFHSVLSNPPFWRTNMSEVDMNDTEFCTPQQAAEIRAMKAELPLWAEFAHPVLQGTIKPETTIDASQVQTDVEAPADVSSGFSADTIALAKMLMSVLADTPSDVTAQLFADIAAHRALNGTTGMESEE